MIVHVLLTGKKAHVYDSRERALKVSQRAERMGVEVEVINGLRVREGDPYRHTEIRPYGWSYYARSECAHGEGA